MFTIYKFNGSLFVGNLLGYVFVVVIVGRPKLGYEDVLKRDLIDFTN